jgi:uncharacterized protein YciI
MRAEDATPNEEPVNGRRANTPRANSHERGARLHCRPMFVIELTYKADLTEIDAHMKAHMAFVNKHYAAGTFVLSGRKIPREGGIILAIGKSREDIEALMRDDPFCSRGLADARVIEFRTSQRAKDIPERIA